MPQQVKKTLVLSIYFTLAVSTLLVFWQVRNFDFIDYDDNVYVYENQHVLNGLTEDGTIWAFTTGNASNWHPLIWLSLMLDCQLFGPGPGGFHLVNILLHIVNILLLFTVLKKMTGALWQSAFVAALFALHPMHVESVAWIAERKDVLSTFFWMLTLLAYFVYVSRPSVFRYIVTLAAFALGLMAKPMLVTLPFVLLLLDYWPLERKISWRLLVEKIPFFVLAVISSVITFLVQRSAGAVSDINVISLNYRITNVFLSYAQYIGKMFWPQNLAVFYPLHAAASFPFWQVAMYALLLLGISVFVVYLGRNRRYLMVGWFWFVGTLIPVIGIVQVGAQAYADRYTYVPYIGLFIMLAWYLPQLLSKWAQRKIAFGLSMILILTTLGICASRQVSYWKNSVTLFSHALAATQNNYIAYHNLGFAYNDLGRQTEAIDAYKNAIRIRPDYAEAHYNLGIAYGRLGRHQEALDAYKQAICIKPNYADAHYGLGFEYGSLGRGTESIDAYKQTIKIKPDYVKAYYSLGTVYGSLGRYQETIDACKQAIRIKPDYAEAHYNIGVACYKLGRGTEAIDAYKQAIGIKPDYAEAYYGLGAVYKSLSRYQDTVEAYKQAIRIKPDYADAQYNLAAAYNSLGQYQDAIESYKQIIRIKPDEAEAHYNLGAIYLITGDKSSALEEYKILKPLDAEQANKLFNSIPK
jgi:tetratricopeptide (TPR) repeat protein